MLIGIARILRAWAFPGIARILRAWTFPGIARILRAWTSLPTPIYKVSSPASIRYSGQWNRTPSWDRTHPACLDFSWDRTHPACVDFIANSIESWSPHPRRLLPFFEPAPNVIRIEELLHRRSNLYDVCLRRKVSGIKELNLRVS